MIRQYRIDRLNGLEILVCEIYRKHTLSQLEYDALAAFREHQRALRGDPEFSVSEHDFKCSLADFLEDPSNYDDKGELVNKFYGLSSRIVTYDPLPCMILRGAVVQNRIASLQVDYDNAVLSPEVFDAVVKFYGVMDSLHWRDMIAHQIERYGSLFEASDD